MVNITREQCEKLRERFNDYCETAEQHEFPYLIKIESAFIATWEELDALIETNPKALNVMFRVVLRCIGAPAEEIEQYKEDSNGN